jgi:hypothetical protein
MAEDEFPLTETGYFFKKNLKIYFVLLEQMPLSPTHMVPRIEASPDDVFQVIILMWPLLCFSTDTPEVSQLKCSCAQLKSIHKV